MKVFKRLDGPVEVLVSQLLCMGSQLLTLDMLFRVGSWNKSHAIAGVIRAPGLRHTGGC